MAISIRLRKAGGKHEACFQVVATDSRRARDGRFVEKIGHYDPRPEKPLFEINRERYDHWLKVGAKVSRTVAQLVAKHPVPAATAES